MDYADFLEEIIRMAIQRYKKYPPYYHLQSNLLWFIDFMTKKKLLQRLQNTYCRLKCSRIHGIGVSAVRNIAKGQNIFPGTPAYRWYKIPLTDLKKFDKYEVLKNLGL